MEEKEQLDPGGMATAFSCFCGGLSWVFVFTRHGREESGSLAISVVIPATGDWGG